MSDSSELPTKTLSTCCQARVYTDYVGPDVIEKLKDRGLVPTKDFPIFIDTDFCSSCDCPCEVIHELI